MHFHKLVCLDRQCQTHPYLIGMLWTKVLTHFFMPWLSAQKQAGS